VASDTAEAEAEDAVDLHELAQSYNFGASLVTVGRIRMLESLGYFVEGLAREPRGSVLEPNTNEVVVFEEFFTVALRMPPHLALTKILLKFWVQLH
jgi:hypothetical protein